MPKSREPSVPSRVPQRLTSQDFDQDLLVLFDAYVHGAMDRRAFLRRAERFAKAGMSAAGLLAALSPDFALGQQVRPDDGLLKTESVTLPAPGGHGSMRGYLARPAAAAGARLPAVLVVHENRGLSPHIEGIARRLVPARAILPLVVARREDQRHGRVVELPAPALVERVGAGLVRHEVAHVHRECGRCQVDAPHRLQEVALLHRAVADVTEDGEGEGVGGGWAQCAAGEKQRQRHGDPVATHPRGL